MGGGFCEEETGTPASDFSRVVFTPTKACHGYGCMCIHVYVSAILVYWKFDIDFNVWIIFIRYFPVLRNTVVSHSNY